MQPIKELLSAAGLSARRCCALIRQLANYIGRFRGLREEHVDQEHTGNTQSRNLGLTREEAEAADVDRTGWR